MDVNVPRPADCPLRKFDRVTDKYYCWVINNPRLTVRCPSSSEFPATCQLKDKNINIKRVK